MKEAVRSGRRTNFFITENRFIDCYAAKVRGSGVAVYSVLRRCANSETRDTWISANKVAEVLHMDKSTVYRRLKQLEDLRLIKTVRTREKTIYYVLDVPPPRPEMGPTPLFDAIDFKTLDQDSIWPLVAPMQMGSSSEIDSQQCNPPVAAVQQPFAPVQPISRAVENRNKEEQDLLNKTQEQDLRGNKTLEQEPPEINKSAKRILEILGLKDSLVATATAALKAKIKQTQLSLDAAVIEIVTAANHAKRRNVPNDKFLEDFAAQASAQWIIECLSLTATNALTSVVTAAIKAEVKFAGLSVEEAAASITRVASEDRQKGIHVDKFYFEDAKWRNYGRIGKGQQQFDRIKRARDEAHAIIDAQMDH